MKRIRRLRQGRGYTQAQLAQWLHINQATYSRYERGKLDIPNDILVKLAALYRVSTDYLLNLTDQKAPYPRSK